MSKTLVQGKLTDINDPSLSYLEVELIRLTSEEEMRNESYNQARTDLQDIWNKIVGLERIIHSHAKEIENLKIECVASRPEEQFWQLHKPSAETGGAVTIYNEQSQQLSLQSAGRLADIQILKEKIRIKEGYRLRLSVLEEKIHKCREQLHQLTESLKVQHKNSHSDATIDYSHGSINASMNIRNLLVETTHNISILEADFMKTNGEYDLLTAELQAALNSKDNQDLFTVTITNQADNSTVTGVGAATPAVASSTSENAVLYQPVTSTETHRKVDGELLEILSHGSVTLSPDLIEAVKKGTFCTTAHLKETAHANSPHTSAYVSKVFDFTLSEVLAGAAVLQRMNGEAAVAYLVRVERRLAALLCMEDELQTELTNKIDDLKVLKKQLHDVELKRLKVELSVSNMVKNRQQIEYNHAINSINSMSLRHSIHLANQQRHPAQPQIPDYYTVLNQVLHEQQRQLSGNGVVRPVYNPAVVPGVAPSVVTTSREQVQLLNQLLELQQSQHNTPVKPADGLHAAAGVRPNHGFAGYQDSPTFQYNEVYDRPLNKIDLMTPGANMLRSAPIATPAPFLVNPAAATAAVGAAGGLATVPPGTPFVWYGDVYEQPMDMLSPTFNPLDQNQDPQTAVKTAAKRVSIAAQHANTVGFGAGGAFSPNVQYGEIYDHQLGYTPMVNPVRPPTVSPFSPGAPLYASQAGLTPPAAVAEPPVPLVTVPNRSSAASASSASGHTMQSNPMRNRGAPRGPPPLVNALAAMDPIPAVSEEASRPFSRTDYISRGLAGSRRGVVDRDPTASPRRSGRRTTGAASGNNDALAEASILQQLTQHIQNLNNNPDSNAVLSHHDEINRLVLLYLSSSATSIQIKVKVLSGLLSTDYNLDGVIKSMESSNSSHVHGATAAASAVDNSLPPAGKSSSRFEEVRRSRAAADAAKALRIDPDSSPSAHASRNNGTNQSYLSSLSTNSPSRTRSRSNSPSKQLLFPSMSGDEELSAFKKDNRTPSKSPTITPTKSANGSATSGPSIAPVLTPLMPPSPVVTNRMSRVLLCGVSTGQTPKKVNKPVQADSSDFEKDVSTTVTATVSAPDVSALVMSPPAKSEISSMTAPSTALSAAPSVIPSANPLPCQCKYCTETPYEYHTLYDRNGRYIGPKNCVRKQTTKAKDGSSSSAAAAAAAPRDVYLHTYMNPHEAEQLFLRRTIDSLKASRSDASSVLSSTTGTTATGSVRSDHKVKHVVETEYLIEPADSGKPSSSAAFASPEKQTHSKNRRSPSLTSGVSHVKKRAAFDRSDPVEAKAEPTVFDTVEDGGEAPVGSEGGILFHTPSTTHKAIRVSGSGGKHTTSSPLSSNQLDVEHRRYTHKADTSLAEETNEVSGSDGNPTKDEDTNMTNDVVTCVPVSSVKSSISSATKKRLARKDSKIPVAHTYNSLTQGTSSTKHVILVDDKAKNGVVETKETFTTGKAYVGCAICARLKVTKTRRETTSGGKQKGVDKSTGNATLTLEDAVEDSEDDVVCPHNDTLGNSWSSASGRLLQLADLNDQLLEDGGNIMQPTPHPVETQKSSPGSGGSKGSFHIASDMMNSKPLPVRHITDVLGRIKLMAADLDETRSRPSSNGSLMETMHSLNNSPTGDDQPRRRFSFSGVGEPQNPIGRMRSNSSDFLLQSIEMQKKEIDELNNQQKALQLMLQNKEVLAQIRSQQSTLMNQLKQTKTGEDDVDSKPESHLRSTATMTSEAPQPQKKKFRRSTSAFVAAVNPSFFCTASLSSINNTHILPESLIKSGAWVRARSRSDSESSNSTAVPVHNVNQLLPGQQRNAAQDTSHLEQYTLESIASASVHNSGGSRASSHRLYNSQSGTNNRNIHYDPHFLGTSEIVTTPNRIGASRTAAPKRGSGVSDVNAENQARAANIVRSTTHRKHTAYINYSYGSSSTQHHHHSNSTGYLNSSMYSDMLAFLTARLTHAQERYHSVGAVEMIHQQTGIAYSTTDGCSKGFVEITVISARNLPPMKTIHKKADAYANINLITIHNNDPLVDHTPLPARTILTIVNTHLSSSNHVSIINNKPATLSPPSSPSARFRYYDQFHGNNGSASSAGGVQLTSDFLTGAPRNVENNYTYDARSTSFQKTSVKAETLFPEWREYFKFHDVHSLQNQSLLISVMDSTKAGFVAHSKDTLIGQCVIPLHSSLLRDQLAHTMWLDLVPPPSNMTNSTAVRRAQVTKLPDQCSIKVEVRLFYSHTQYWRDQCTEMQNLINKLNEIYDHTSDQHRQYSYAQDKTVLDKITKLMMKHGHTTSARDLQDPVWNHPEPQQRPAPVAPPASTVPIMRKIVGLRERGREEGSRSKSGTSTTSSGGPGSANKTIKRGRSLIPRPEEEEVGRGDSFYSQQQPPHHKPRQTATPSYTSQGFFTGGGSAGHAPESDLPSEREVSASQVNLDGSESGTVPVRDSESALSHHDMSIDYSNQRVDLSIFRQSGGRRLTQPSSAHKNAKSPHHHQPLGFNSSDAREFEL